MTVTPLPEWLSAAIARQSAPFSTPAASAAASISSAAAPSADENASIVDVLRQPTQIATLSNASVSFAQLGSLLQVAQAGTQQVGSILEQLQALAQQAANEGPGSDLGSLSSEFQNFISQIDLAVNGASFGGTSLLDGSLSASAGTSQDVSSLSLPDISNAGLFGAVLPQIASPQDAIAAVQLLGGGAGYGRQCE